jgi:hypothetical protein
VDEGIQTLEEDNQESDNAFFGHDTSSCRKPVGRKPRSCIDATAVASRAAGVTRRIFPGLNRRFATLPDPRRPEFCKYSSQHIWWSGTLMFLTRSGSRNAFDLSRNSGTAPANMGEFCGQKPDDYRFDGQPLITCSDNMAHHFNRVDASIVQEIPKDMTRELITRRLLESARIMDQWYVVVFDGTVQEKCRKGFEEGWDNAGGKTTRYRYVLQCGLLGPANTIFPLMHEHIDMHDPIMQKEDCELEAFKRLVKRLKKEFPHMKFCIVGDALFCVAAVADICAEYNWKYSLTLKEGRQPGIWEEVLSLLPLCKENVLRIWTAQDGGLGLRDFRWVENLPIGQQECTVVLSGEFTGSEGTLYVYATNFRVSKDRMLKIIPATGRERHHIEDYFNTGKNNGIGLGHVFCAKSNAAKNFFTLMQIAWILWTILCHGYLMRIFDWAARATEKALAHAIGEGMRSQLFPSQLPMPGQIRFVT